MSPPIYTPGGIPVTTSNGSGDPRGGDGDSDSEGGEGTPAVSPDRPLDLLLFAASTAPASVHFGPLLPLVRSEPQLATCADGSTEARFRIAMPITAVENMFGPDEEQDVFFLLQVRREVYEEMKERAEAGEWVGAGAGEDEEDEGSADAPDDELTTC